MSIVAAILVASSLSSSPALIIPPPPRIRDPRTIVADAPPPIEKIVEIEELARARPWKFTPTGALKVPSGEARELSCTRNDRRHFACSYEIRFAPYGETEFGEWIPRRKVYRLTGEGWLQLNAERHCAKVTETPLPAYCYPE